jgi:regulator of sigma E protease
MQLPDELFVRAGKPVAFVVERKVDGKVQTVELTATPDSSVPGVEPVILDTKSLKLPGLGLAIEVEPKVAAVAPDSPAARAGIKAGDTIAGVIFPPAPEQGKKAKPLRVVFGKATSKADLESSWPYVFSYLQDRPKGEFELILAGASTPIKVTPVADPKATNIARGLNFLTVQRNVPPQPFASAVKRGADETYDNVVSIYAMIRSLFAGRVSTQNLAGLPRIADIAYKTATMGFVPLLQFLGMLSINLAVLNFLPISPLDGGQIAFLVAEKIRGKPLPESAHSVIFFLGAAMVISLMLFTVIQDLFLMYLG